MGWDQLEAQLHEFAAARGPTGELLVWTDPWLLWCRWAPHFGVTPGKVELAVTVAPAKLHGISNKLDERLINRGWEPTWGGLTLVSEVHAGSLPGEVATLAAEILRDDFRMSSDVVVELAGRDRWDSWALPHDELRNEAPWEQRQGTLADQLRKPALRIRDRWRDAAAIARGSTVVKSRFPAPNPPAPSAEELDRRFDADALRRAKALVACAEHASSAIFFVEELPELREPYDQLLRLVDAGELDGVWPPMLTLREMTAPLFVKLSAARNPNAPDRGKNNTSVSWWQIHVTTVLFAEPAPVLERALREGVISAGDFRYVVNAILVWPRTSYSQTAKRGRELIRWANATASIAEPGAGSYDVAGLLANLQRPM